MINVKNNPDYSAKINSKCDRYFCNYCLKGSYQVNVDQLSNPNNRNQVQGTNPINQNTLNHQKKFKPNKPKLQKHHDTNKVSKSKSKKAKFSLSKDWCCPWCTNDCFCSRCLREEQIFKLIATYFFYEGDMVDLLIAVRSENEVLRNLGNELVISKLEIKDFTFLERQCKNSSKNPNGINCLSKGQSNNLGSSGKSFYSGNLSLSSVTNDKDEKIVRLSKRGRIEKKINKSKNKLNKLLKNSNNTLKVGLVKPHDNLDLKLREYSEIENDYIKTKVSLQLLQKNLCDRLPLTYESQFTQLRGTKRNKKRRKSHAAETDSEANSENNRSIQSTTEPDKNYDLSYDSEAASNLDYNSQEQSDSEEPNSESLSESKSERSNSSEENSNYSSEEYTEKNREKESRLKKNNLGNIHCNNRKVKYKLFGKVEKEGKIFVSLGSKRNKNSLLRRKRKRVN